MTLRTEQDHMCGVRYRLFAPSHQSGACNGEADDGDSSDYGYRIRIVSTCNSIRTGGSIHVQV
jgi:hypothetical protein